MVLKQVCCHKSYSAYQQWSKRDDKTFDLELGEDASENCD